MGCVIVLLLAILVTMIFGPAPVLILGGVGVALALMAAIGIMLGEAAIRVTRRGPPRAAHPIRPAPSESHFTSLSPAERAFYRWTALAIFAAVALLIWAFR